MPIDRASLIPALKNIATRLRIDSARATSEAGTGHPTSCFSMAEIMAALSPLKAAGTISDGDWIRLVKQLGLG